MPSIERTMNRLYVLVIVLVIACGALVVALLAALQSSDAAAEGKHVAVCVNTALAKRAPATGDETAAQVAVATALYEAASKGELTNAVVAKITDNYLRALQHVQAERAATPLGRC